MTDWSEALIEDYLNILENLVLLSNLIDIEIDQKIEEIPTDFSDGSIPFVESGFLAEDNANLSWDDINDILSALYIATDKIAFNLSAGITPAEGEVSWNDDDGALNIGMPGGNVIAQIPLEALARVVNKTGSTIANGSLVYVSGSQGDRDTIALADNTDVNTIFILGMATESINNNLNGYVARFGYVRGSATEPVDTSGTVAGDPVYLGTAGGFTVTHPSGPTDAVVIVGNVNRVHATEGVISLQPPKAFTIGNEFNGTIRQSVINKSAGISAASGFTAINDNNHFTTIGIAGSGNTTFPGEVSIHYAPGYGDHWQAVDGNKDFVWYSDPTDSHNNSSLTNEIMRLVAAGHLKLVKDNSKMYWGAGDDMSAFYDGSDGNIKTDEVTASDLKLSCGTDKTIELQETVYEDIQFSISGGRVPAANAPTFSIFTTNTKEYQFDVSDLLYLDANEYAHAFKNAAAWVFHLHATTDIANASGSSQYAKFTLYVAYADRGDTWTETSVTAELEIPDGTSALQAFILGLGTVSPSKNIGTQIKLTITRIAATGGTEYPDEIFLTQVGLHGEVNTMGSRQIGTK